MKKPQRGRYLYIANYNEAMRKWEAEQTKAGKPDVVIEPAALVPQTFEELFTIANVQKLIPNMQGLTHAAFINCCGASIIWGLTVLDVPFHNSPDLSVKQMTYAMFRDHTSYNLNISYFPPGNQRPQFKITPEQRKLVRKLLWCLKMSNAEAAVASHSGGSGGGFATSNPTERNGGTDEMMLIRGWQEIGPFINGNHKSELRGWFKECTTKNARASDAIQDLFRSGEKKEAKRAFGG